jgi:REP element-mobilizing transposase RayT
MSELRKANYDALFFVTLTVAGWVDVFSRRQYADIVIGALQYCQAYKGLEIYGYVLMTNHLHLLAAQQQGELNKVLGHFKSYTGKEILRSIEEQPESRREWMLMVFRYHARYKSNYKTYYFWQETNHAIDCYSWQLAVQKLDYMHENPVRAGYVAQPQDWLYSSAHPRSPLKVLPL